MGTKGKRGTKKNPAKLNVLRGPEGDFVSRHSVQVPEAGVTQTEFEQGNRAVSETSGPTSGPIGPDLQIVIHAWPHLSKNTKRKILREVQQALK